MLRCGIFCNGVFFVAVKYKKNKSHSNEWLYRSGALVQLVRIRACHARGQGFESPTHRTRTIKPLIRVAFVFFYT